jgi:CubicO group peptidase (beta-lactamase class C family)
MSSSGFSHSRLGRMHAVLGSYVERGEVPGLVALVSRRGEVHAHAIGAKALGGEPMRRDTLFRIASMSKPMAAAAAMILVEECVLRLDDPVDRFLPELANRRVLARLDGPIDETVPAKRPITLRDLLTLRMGFGFIMGSGGTYPIHQAAVDLGIRMGPPTQSEPPPDEWMRRVGTLPLMRQPGEAWMYDLALDVLGVLLARAAGQPLETFLHQRLFAPLGMKDTAFGVPKEKLDRLATAYSPHPDTGALEITDGVEGSLWERPPVFPSAAGGLVSTIDDCLAFGQMLLDFGRQGGRHGRERLLSRSAVELMTTDHLTPEQKAGNELFLGEGGGWGFGLSVVHRRNDLWEVPGRYGWNGGLGTCWANDPQENLVGILLTQRGMTSPMPPAVFRDFWTLAYQAIDD